MSELREKIGRAIDARCFEYEAKSDRAKYIQEADQKAALKKADAILNLLQTEGPGPVGDVGELVAEMASVIEGHLTAMYLDADGKPQHPVFERKYNRDMEIVHRARTALARSAPGWRSDMENAPENWPVDVWAPGMGGPMVGIREVFSDGSWRWNILYSGLEEGGGSAPHWGVPLFEVTHWSPRLNPPASNSGEGDD